MRRVINSPHATRTVHSPNAVPDMMSSSTGPSGVELTGLGPWRALKLEAPQRPKNPERCFVGVAVCVDDASERMLGDGDAAFDVAGVA